MFLFLFLLKYQNPAFVLVSLGSVHQQSRKPKHIKLYCQCHTHTKRWHGSEIEKMIFFPKPGIDLEYLSILVLHWAMQPIYLKKIFMCKRRSFLPILPCLYKRGFCNSSVLIILYMVRYIFFSGKLPFIILLKKLYETKTYNVTVSDFFFYSSF